MMTSDAVRAGRLGQRRRVVEAAERDSGRPGQPVQEARLRPAAIELRRAQRH
jgi:hypothetical protein